MLKDISVSLFYYYCYFNFLFSFVQKENLFCSISEVNWGSSTQAQTYKAALNSIQQLVHIEEHVKNYRPQILVMSGLPSARPPLIDFAYLICKQLSLMVCGHVVKRPMNQRARAALTQRVYHWFGTHRIKSFYSLVDNSGFKGVCISFVLKVPASVP